MAYLEDPRMSGVMTSSSTDEETDKLARVARDLRLALAVTQLTLGTFGNCLSFIIMSKKPMKNTSAGIYFAAIAVGDTIYLYIGLISYLMDYFDGIKVQGLHPWSCKIVRFVLFTSGDASVWLLVVITVDRFIAVCLPLRAKSACTPQKAKIVCLVTCITAVTKNLHIFWTRGAQIFYKKNGIDINNIVNCGYPTSAAKYFEKFVRPWLAFITLAVIPVLLIISLNFLIVRALKRQRDFHPIPRSSSNTSERSSTTHDRFNMTGMFLGVSVEYLILIPPCYIILIMRPYISLTTSQSSYYSFVQDVVFSLQYTHYAINFYLYCLTARRFRKEVKNLFCPPPKRHKDSTHNNNGYINGAIRDTTI